MKKLKVAIGVLIVLVVGGPLQATNAVSNPTISTDPAPLAFTADGQSIAEVIHMRITAYASVPDETDNTPFITASGLHVSPDFVATNILPFGTKIEIPALFGDRVFTVEDRMNKVFKDSVDIWMPTVNQAIDFGVNYADIEVLQGPAVAKDDAPTNISVATALAFSQKGNS